METKILPYFGQRKISEITTKDVIAWQNEQLAYRDEKHKPYSQTYLKTLHNQLSAIFNHAVRFYDLRANPASKAGNMGNEERREMLFWTKEEYQKFAAEMMDKPVSYYAFEMLYWCGIREGELLALTPADFDFQNSTVRINKSYQRLKGQDVITSPKTKKSNRTIQMPDFLCQEMQEFFKMQYGLKKKDRIFTVTKSYLHHEMDRGAKAAGVEGTDNLHFAVYAKQPGAGLDEQLEKFIREHPDTRLIIIDTLQKIREVSTDAYSYANDYDIVGRMKQFADKNGVCLLLVHHTRKQQAGDKFEMISGATGLLGCADGAFLLQKEKHTDLNATLEIVGRDQPDQKLHLTRDAEKLTWQLDHAETELWKKPPDPLLSKLAAVIAGDTPVWNGSATELVALWRGYTAQHSDPQAQCQGGRTAE